MIVDAHCHASPVWYEPVETLLSCMDRAGVQAAVLIQVLGQFDNAYQQACLARFPGRFASVVAVDADRPDAPAALRQLVEAGASGVRLRPNARSPGDDPLALWRTAEALGIAVSCAGSHAQLASAEFADLLAGLPRLVVVLEHLAGLARPDVGDLEAARETALALARFANVRVKVPGLGQLAARKLLLPAEGPALEPGPIGLIAAFADRFGPERLMWGSDFPPVAAREGYANALDGPRSEALAALSATDRDLVFGENAARTFKLA